MKMNFVSTVATESVAEIFAAAGYQGEALKLARGEYDDVKAVGSIKVADFTRVAFYENADGSGKHVIVDKDCAAAEVAFAPQLTVVETYAKGFKGDVAKELPEGEYTAAELKEFDKVIVPRGFYAVFAGNNEDEHTVRIFENEECVIDGKVDEYAKVLLFTLGKDDVRINFGIKEELTDDDLLVVAGGKGCGNKIKAGAGSGTFCGNRTGIEVGL
ncbi:MAG: hypothetical protein Q4E64_02765 [Phascolarctobacterium sp.]|uniref:hypothetical protein n=1 Tax=Phascolarctobacterium sp. TaxID=2049039 RepID=UPI0026DCF9EC|nr:hypothetical protein [Phascolarctobacterium sp.]MDO4920736.1 hypothetical protein [Phascolarctobacterium sp.]